MTGRMRNEEWERELRSWLAPLKLLIFAGLVKNAGKTTALNAVSKIFAAECLGLVSLGYDGEGTDAIYLHLKPPIFVKQGQLVLTAEHFLPETKEEYGLLESWGEHPQFGPWCIVRISKDCAFRMAGPASVSELKDGIERLRRWGAERILVDGALNRLSHTLLSHTSLLDSFEGRTGIILSTGAALGNSLAEVSKRTRYWLELFSLPEIAQDEHTEAPFKDMPFASSTGNAYFLDGKWVPLPALLWEKNIKELLPPGIEVIYIHGGFTDALYLSLRTAQRLPGEFLLRSPAQVLLREQVWQGLKSRNIQVKLLKRPNLVLLTLSPWHPLRPISTDRMAEALLPFCRIPLVDVQEQKIWRR